MLQTTLCQQRGIDSPRCSVGRGGGTSGPDLVAAGHPPTGRCPGGGTMVGNLLLADTLVEEVRYAVIAPTPGFTGDLDYLALYAGESCRLVHDIKPAAQIVRDVMRQAEEVMAQIQDS